MIFINCVKVVIKKEQLQLHQSLLVVKGGGAKTAL